MLSLMKKRVAKWNKKNFKEKTQPALNSTTPSLGYSKVTQGRCCNKLIESFHPKTQRRYIPVPKENIRPCPCLTFHMETSTLKYGLNSCSVKDCSKCRSSLLLRPAGTWIQELLTLGNLSYKNQCKSNLSWKCKQSGNTLNWPSVPL